MSSSESSEEAIEHLPLRSTAYSDPAGTSSAATTKQVSYIEVGVRAIKKPPKRFLNRCVYAHPILYDEATVHSLDTEDAFSVDRFDVCGVLPAIPSQASPSTSVIDHGWCKRSMTWITD